MKEQKKSFFALPTWQRIAAYAALLFIASFGMAIILRLCKLDEFQSAAQFFTWSVFKEIFIVTAILFILLAVAFAYVFAIKRERVETPKYLGVISVSLLITFGLCLLMANLLNLYLTPLLLTTLLTASLVDKRAGVLINAVISPAFLMIYIVLFGTAQLIPSVASLITSIATGIVMVLFLNKTHTRVGYISVGVIVSLILSVLPILINLLVGSVVEEVFLSGLYTFAAGTLSVGLYMVLLPFMEYIFKLTSPYRITELSALSEPLLQRLAKEAPGTFNHSLMVGNLSELCAQAIGEDGALARCAAYYHDVGKLKAPEYFTENQKGYNPHDDFIPEVSVRIITQHTENGYEMLKHTQLPKVVVNAAREHHGTSHVNYFLYKAKNLTESAVDAEKFRYSGPRPTTKISAILMICDTAEAASRAQGITTSEALRAFIHGLIEEKMRTGQFEDCPITLKDLKIIEDTLVEALPGIYHTRIKYEK